MLILKGHEESDVVKEKSIIGIEAVCITWKCKIEWCHFQVVVVPTFSVTKLLVLVLSSLIGGDMLIAARQMQHNKCTLEARNRGTTPVEGEAYQSISVPKASNWGGTNWVRPDELATFCYHKLMQICTHSVACNRLIMASENPIETFEVRCVWCESSWWQRMLKCCKSTIFDSSRLSFYGTLTLEEFRGMRSTSSND